ncbi:MAG: YdaS family helix-turn-helix protein [Pseudomonadota bacterium]
MNLSKYINKHPRGELARLAKAISAHAPDISRWASGKRPVPVHKVASIVDATNGAVTRKDLRPNDWMRIWPELAGEVK